MAGSAISPKARPSPLAAALIGGGEMGALIREKDWSATPLGSPERWPHSLRTAVGIMLESRYAMVVTWGPEFRFFYNDRYLPVLGAKHPASLGMPAVEIFPEVWHAIGPEFERALGGVAFATEDWLLPITRNGYLENCWFTVSYSPIRDDSGEVGGLLLVVAETTDRVQGERRLATLRELARSTDARTATQACERAAAIFAANTMDVPFSLTYLLCPDGKGARLVAASNLEPGSKAAPTEIDLTSSNGAAGWPLQAAIANHEVLVVENLGDTFGALPGGDIPEPAHTALVLPLARAGSPHPYGVLVLGVSPRRALDDRYRSFMELAAEHVVAGIATATAYEEERRRAEMLAELDRAKTVFFSNVSHEFRTPLTLMLGPIEDLLAGARGSLPAAALDELSAAHRNALRLLKLVNSLLDFSRLEAGRANALYARVDLAALTSDLASVFRAAIERAGLRFTVRCELLSAPVFVDRDMWEKIVLNLLSNALKFTFEGEIAVELRQRGEVVELEVRDTGVGIPVTELPNIFKRFHRVQETRARTHEGTGIGLALVHDLVALHGGTIDVASTPGQGSRFVASVRTGAAHLPREQIVDSRATPVSTTAIRSDAFVAEAMRWIPGTVTEATAGPVASPSAHSGKHHGRILVVDDNADMRAYIERLLSQRYDVETAGDGAEALRRIGECLPDLVVTDVMMPKLDGFGLLKALRADDRTRELPVIMLSARAGEDSRVEGLEEGADDYVVKPFTARELLARVQTHLDQARLRMVASKERERLSELERRRVTSAFEKAPSIIAMLRGPDFVFEAANAAYRAVVGNRDLLGKPIREALPEAEGQGYFEQLEHVYSTGTPHVGKEARAFLRRAPDMEPEEMFFDYVYQPLTEPDGRVSGVLVHGFEVTAQVRARREIETLYQRVSEANDAKVKFLAAMSHELRTPLNAILGYAELLALGVRGQLVDAQRGDVERIRGAAHYLLGLINDILNFTRVEASQVAFDIQPVDVNGMLDRASELVTQPMAEKSLRFEFIPPTQVVTANADAERTQQVLLNLLTNAIKFTEAGGSIRLACESDNGMVRIHVRDTGRGIAQENWDRVFEPFVQLDRSGDRSGRQGVGLGLAISRDLARRMGGDIVLQSTVGVGSDFVLTLPVHRAEALGDQNGRPTLTGVEK